MKERLKPSQEVRQLLKFIRDLGIRYHVVKNAPFRRSSCACIPQKGALTDIKRWQIILCLDNRQSRPLFDSCGLPNIQDHNLWLLYSLAHELGHVLTPLYFSDPDGTLCGHEGRMGWRGNGLILNENMAWHLGSMILQAMFGKEILRHYNTAMEWCLSTHIKFMQEQESI